MTGIGGIHCKYYLGAKVLVGHGVRVYFLYFHSLILTICTVLGHRHIHILHSIHKNIQQMGID